MADEDHDQRELDDDPDVVAGHREVVAAVGRDLLGELEKGPHAREAEKAHQRELMRRGSPLPVIEAWEYGAI